MAVLKQAILILVLLTLIFGCAEVRRDKHIQLTMAAPDYLKGILETATAQFKEENNITIRIVYDKSGSVISRVRSSPEIDLFIAASRERFDRLLPDSVMFADYYSCPFRLSLFIAHRFDGPKATDPKHLMQDRFRRVVIIDPENGYEGLLAKEILKRFKVWDKLSSKIVKAESREHMLSYLASGEADAAVILESSLHGQKGFVSLRRLDLGIEEHLIHCGAVTRWSQNQKTARAFLDFLDSPFCGIYKITGVYRRP